MNDMPIVQIIVSIILIVLISIQARGTGLGKVWGQSSNYFARRGLEGILFKATIALIFIFLVIAGSQLVS